MKLLTYIGLVAVLLVSFGCGEAPQVAPVADEISGADGIPQYAVDPSWPKPLPNNWILGQAAGIATDSEGHVWVLHRPGSLTDDERGAALDPPVSKCCISGPPVLEFDTEGNLLNSWGGPGDGYEWPTNEHGIHVDSSGNVWIAGNGETDHQILKFDGNGKFLLQIGHSGESQGSNVTDQLGRPAHMVVDSAADELYVADGYQNRRVIVFDATTGGYKRHWGAYGNTPDDTVRAPFDLESPQFGEAVHCIRIMRDDSVFVCDRANNRIQVFDKDGEFLRQIVLEPGTRSGGSVWDLVPSEDGPQRYILVADGTNNEVHILTRETGERVASFGGPGRNAGRFHWIHNIAMDTAGNVYTTEVDTGKRVQKFQRVE